MTSPRFPFPSLPAGWYSVGLASELLPGTVVPLRRFGRELALFRTQGGRVGLFDAHCPHLGAHLGGGVVEGELLVCPFHRLGFATDGRCGSQPRCYPGKIPEKLSARPWPLLERDGFLVAWYDPLERPAAWEPPTTDLVPFRPLRTRRWTLRTHTQETGEGSVDLAHLQAVHQYLSAEALHPVATEGPMLRAAYRLERRAAPGMHGDTFHMDIHVRLNGLGFSTVDVTLPKQGFSHRLWVLSTPIDSETIDYRVALAMRAPESPERVHRALGLLPRPVAVELVEAMLWREFVRDVELDFPIWESKAYVDPPRLLAGDGPIGHFRKWARQFYAALPTAEASAATPRRQDDHAGTTTSANPSAPPTMDDQSSPRCGPSEVKRPVT
ncbi:MAG: Rieske 2Fe-2S domain-containing protein [Deltaproteobacteria bacterium]|nr:Rieske 2Fe-2S domain-containing protein [Deltaproteobacteria bacterium]